MKIKLFLLICVVLGTVSCSPVETPPPAPTTVRPPTQISSVQVLPNKLEETRFYYRGDLYRDPFTPVTSTFGPQMSSEGAIIPSLSALVLSGLIIDGNQSIALLKAGNMGYTLRNGKLYDIRQRSIRGMSGVIRSESVIITGPNRSHRELRLREKAL